jgi:hypothetical protein
VGAGRSRPLTVLAATGSSVGVGRSPQTTTSLSWLPRVRPLAWGGVFREIVGAEVENDENVSEKGDSL